MKPEEEKEVAAVIEPEEAVMEVAMAIAVK